MTTKKNPAGLLPRQMGAERLALVLKGQSFSPFTADEIADGRDRALANRLVTTALRRWGHLNIILKKLLDRGLPKRSGLFNAVVRIGLTELLFVPGAEAHAAVFLAGEVLKRDKRAQHLGKLLNGVLRQADRQRDELTALAPDLLLPEWLRGKWAKSYGADAPDLIAKALLAGAELDLTLKSRDAKFADELDGVLLPTGSLRIKSRDKPVNALPGYDEGDFWVQDAAAALPAQLIDGPKGAKILDICAAPGGKTAQLAAQGYEVTALDLDAKRMERVQDNLARLKLGAEMVVADAIEFSPGEIYDAVLVDAPCSATGTLRRHPEVIWQRKPEDVGNRQALQRDIVSAALRALKPGGVLVFCTCSLEFEEGEAQVKWVTDTYPDVQLDVLEPGALPGLDPSAYSHGGVRTVPGLTFLAKDDGSVDGFFMARFRKVAFQE